MRNLNQTLKIFETDSYKTEHKSKLAAIDENLYAIALDETIFFATGGGQDYDLGFIEGCPVINVEEREGVIWHFLDKNREGCSLENQLFKTAEGVFDIGDEVRSGIDFERRYDHMVQHTAEHIFSGIVLKEYGFKSTGFHIGKPYVRVDYSGYLGDDMLDKVLQEANKAVRMGIDVRIYKADYEELRDVKYRSKKEIEGAIRIVDCGVDVCACCATHVKNTGEVGLIVIVSNEKYKGGSRLSLLAGDRALDYVRRLSKITYKLGAILSSPVENLEEAATALKEKAAKLDMDNYALQKILAEEIHASFPLTERRIILDESLSPKLMNALIVRMADSYGGYFIGLSLNGEDCAFTIADSNGGADEMAKNLFSEFAYKGGGKNTLFQGKFKATADKIERVLSSITK